MPKQSSIRLLLVVALLAAFITPVFAVNNGDTPVNTTASARRMIEDLTKTHGAKYKGGKDFLARLTAIEAKLKANAGDNNTKWTTYKKKKAKLVNSAECLSDTEGRETGKLGCRNITFRRDIKINLLFGHDRLRR